MTIRNTTKLINSLEFVKCRYSSEFKEYRVTCRYGSKEMQEQVAYYTNDSDDAIRTTKMLNEMPGIQLLRFTIEIIK